jgi:cobalt-zinc-cadmium efflux system membrane fusion protein
MNDQEMDLHQVTAVTVEAGKLKPVIELKGKLIFHPDLVAHIVPKISGIAKESKKKLGDHVEKGELMAILESKEMADAKALYLDATSHESLMQKQWESQQALEDKKIGSKAALESAQNAYEEAVIAKNLAKEKLLSFGLFPSDLENLSADYRLYEIRSPLKGTVIQRHLTQGEYVEGNEPIFEVADLSKVWVEIPVPQQEMKALKRGSQVRVELPCAPGSYQAELVYISPFVEQASITGKAIAELKNDNEIHCPGSYVKVFIEGATSKTALLVPKKSVQEIEGEKVVFVREGDLFVKRIVQLGAEDNTHVEVVEGLQRGERVAHDGSFLLKADLGKYTMEHEH